MLARTVNGTLLFISQDFHREVSSLPQSTHPFFPIKGGGVCRLRSAFANRVLCPEEKDCTRHHGVEQNE